MKNTIFTITTISQLDDCRCVGFYFSMQEAMDAVKDNIGSIQECYYEYLVIEEFSSGIYAAAQQEIWYEWQEKYKEWGYLKKKPNKFNGIISFGIG